VTNRQVSCGFAANLSATSPVSNPNGVASLCEARRKAVAVCPICAAISGFTHLAAYRLPS